jgi:hypothetical protein
MSERISHQSEDNKTPSEWNILTSKQTQVEPDVAMPDSDEIAGSDTQPDDEDSIDESKSIDEKEKEASKPITTQEIFDRTMEAAPEGEDPATYIYSKDGFQAFMNQMDACEREGYSSVDTQNAFYEFAGDYMDHGGRIPDGMDDAIFGTDSYYSSLDELLNDHSEIVKAQNKLRKYYSEERLQTLLETNPRKILC